MIVSLFNKLDKDKKTREYHQKHENILKPLSEKQFIITNQKLSFTGHNPQKSNPNLTKIKSKIERNALYSISDFDRDFHKMISHTLNYRCKSQVNFISKFIAFLHLYRLLIIIYFQWLRNI